MSAKTVTVVPAPAGYFAYSVLVFCGDTVSIRGRVPVVAFVTTTEFHDNGHVSRNRTAPLTTSLDDMRPLEPTINRSQAIEAPNGRIYWGGMEFKTTQDLQRLVLQLVEPSRKPATPALDNMNFTFTTEGGHQICVIWDDEAGVLVAESDHIPGLVVEAAGIDELLKRVDLVAEDLLSEAPAHA